jgi:hypothetical protein
MPKKINIKNKIKLYTKNKWHQDIVAAYNLYKRTKNPEAKKKIEDHYRGKEIIWEERLFGYLKNNQKKVTNEKLKKIFEKKEIKIGKLTSSFLSKKIIEKQKIIFSNFSIINEIIIIENIISDKRVDLKAKSIIQKPLSLKNLKRKISKVRNKNNFYFLLDEYLSFIFKRKKIEIDDFKKRNLILLLMDRKKIKYKKYGLSKNDLLKI